MNNIIRYDLAWKGLMKCFEKKENSNAFYELAEMVLEYHTYISGNEVKRRYKKYGLTETVLNKKRKERKLRFVTRHYGDAFQYLYHENEIKKLVEELKNGNT